MKERVAIHQNHEQLIRSDGCIPMRERSGVIATERVRALEDREVAVPVDDLERACRILESRDREHIAQELRALLPAPPLKPCPFCGGKARAVTTMPGKYCSVVCDQAQRCCESARQANMETAIKVWNRRSP